MKKLTLSLIAIVACVGLAFGQQSKTDESVEFRPNWGLQLQGGVAHTIGETAFADLLSPAAFLSVNYEFHHAMGIRLGVGGWQGKGYIIPAEQGYAYKFGQLNADFMLDFSSLVGGFNHKRAASVYLFAGIGGLYGFDNEGAQDIAVSRPNMSSELEYLWDKKAFVAGRVGLGVDFRLSDCVNFNIEGNANMLSDHFNSKRAENIDWQFNLLAGFSFRFGKNYQPSAAYAAKQAAAEQALALAAAEKAAAEKAAAEAAAEKAAAEKAAAEKAAAEKAAAEKAAAAAKHAALAKEHSDNVFFLLDSSVIRKSEAEKITAIAEWMKANPEYKITIVGYADKETGKPSSNLRLSERRVNNVKAALIKAGVAENLITTDFKGDTVRPFDVQEQNRVVICTLE